MNIIFFGSGQFALPIIKKIHEEYTLLGVVITKPKRSGRRLKLILPEVAIWAESRGIKVFTPENPNSDYFIQEISKLKPDLFVLSSYGYILGTQLLEVPKLGGINIHPSLLPKYRGAAPIQRAIMAGEKNTGITIIMMDEKIDHGDIIFEKEITIDPDDNYVSLQSRLSTLGVEIITQVLRSVESGNYKRSKQDEGSKSYAKKISKEETIIDWQQSAAMISNLIRALSPKPGARTKFRGKELQIIKAKPCGKKIEPGKINIDKRQVYIGTGNGSIMLEQVKPENRAPISGYDFINGFHVKEGEVVG